MATTVQQEQAATNGEALHEDKRDNRLLDEVIDNTVETMEQISPLVRAEIDIQIATAKRYPRSIRKFLDAANTMATLNEEIAASCMYALPRGGKRIEGPSARLAEIVMVAWTNLRSGSRVVEEGDKFIAAQGYCHDLENNNAYTSETRRRITDKKGVRFNDDMLIMTGNAAASIAHRNAVFKCIPKAYWWQVYIAARQCAIGNAKTLSAKRTEAMAYVGKMGVSEARVLAILDKKAIDDVDLEDLAFLRGLITSVKDGTNTVDEAFPETKEGATDAVQAKLGKTAAKPAAAPAKTDAAAKPAEKPPEREPGVEDEDKDKAPEAPTQTELRDRYAAAISKAPYGGMLSILEEIDVAVEQGQLTDLQRVELRDLAEKRSAATTPRTGKRDRSI